MEGKQTHSILALALVLGLIFHGTSIFFTLESTYDALVHLFFADHYAKDWFEPWDYRWYTGFTVQGYPPLVHQSIALLSFIGGLKFGLFTMTLLIILLFISGLYRFALIISGSRKIAGYTALLGAFSSVFLETLHVFGQLPSLMGLSVLLHALPEVYYWIKTGKIRYLLSSLSLIALTVTSHHVTPIFGMVFFIFPLIGMVIMDKAKDRVKQNQKITFSVFFLEFKHLFWRIVFFGLGSLFLITFCILPYWVNSKRNPITQVPIPHGSRDSFLEVTSSGLVFFVIPWGILLFLFPYLFYRFFSKRLLFFGFSFSLLFLLGTGGTTPIPRLLLGETAFNILTLDRFTLWASIMALPLLGEFTYRLIEGDFRKQIVFRHSRGIYYLIAGALGVLFISIAIFTMSLNYFRPSQPQKIKMLPILNFLNQDQHDRWRYLPLGFGDQMAWLSAQTNAMTVDGNYHSARRLPELTTRAVERLENSKFRGVEGIGSLQQFLTVPEKYHLKYIFSNDKFYDPLLFFCGWQRLQQLENGIMVWERLNVPPLPKIIPKEDVSQGLKAMWGTIPILTLVFAFVINIQLFWYRKWKQPQSLTPDTTLHLPKYTGIPKRQSWLFALWALLAILLFAGMTVRFYLDTSAQRTPENVVKAYYDALDYKEFEKAYSYLFPGQNVSLSQYMLEISVSDGLLSSYAKLDAIDVRILERQANEALIEVSTDWITPLEKVEKKEIHHLQKHHRKWYLHPKKSNHDIPPEQLIATNTTNFYNHGRRRITSQQTYHEDILRQPLLQVLSAKLVRKNGRYSIIGELQNIDNVPADISVSGSLYNEQNKLLATYDAKDLIKHKLLPQEKTVFRIDFEGVAWTSIQESIPPTFDPDAFTPIALDEIPATFDLQCAGNVATTDLYPSVALQDVYFQKNGARIILFNSGTQEVTVPQVLSSYYGQDGSLLWVDRDYSLEGIRVQRTQEVALVFRDVTALDILEEGTEKCYVNGIPNQEIVKKYGLLKENRIPDNFLKPLGAKGFTFIRLDTNSYIGNPR